jgi:hypothetical protein
VKKAIQAKHLPDGVVLRAVLRIRKPYSWDGISRHPDGWLPVMRAGLEAEFPGVPWKVLLAKCRSLIRRGLLDGCACGCCGSYEITYEGQCLLDELTMLADAARLSVIQ